MRTYTNYMENQKREIRTPLMTTAMTNLFLQHYLHVHDVLLISIHMHLSLV